MNSWTTVMYDSRIWKKIGREDDKVCKELLNACRGLTSDAAVFVLQLINKEYLPHYNDNKWQLWPQWVELQDLRKHKKASSREFGLQERRFIQEAGMQNLEFLNYWMAYSEFSFAL